MKIIHSDTKILSYTRGVYCVCAHKLIIQHGLVEWVQDISQLIKKICSLNKSWN